MDDNDLEGLIQPETPLAEPVEAPPPSYAKASEDTPSSSELRLACHPKLEERRVVGDERLELPTSSV